MNPNNEKLVSGIYDTLRLPVLDIPIMLVFTLIFTHIYSHNAHISMLPYVKQLNRCRYCCILCFLQEETCNKHLSPKTFISELEAEL